MEGSSRAFGIGPEIELCGKKFRVRAKTAKCYAEVEAYLRQHRGDPAAMLAGRALEFAKLNTRPFFEQLRALLKDKAKRDNWPEQSFHHAKALLEEAERTIDTTAVYEDLMGRAFDEARKWSIVTLWDIHEFLETTWTGQCMKVWFAIRDNDPDSLTLERVSQMFHEELMRRTREGGEEAALQFRQELEQAIGIAEGTDQLGNLTGSPPTSSPPAAPTTTPSSPPPAAPDGTKFAD